jgi:hypothetical protein
VNRCLRDKALAALFAGEERPEWREHLRGCRSCAVRYRALERDMRVAVDALVAGPPAGLHRPARAAAWRWAPAVAALGLALALVVQLFPGREAPVQSASPGELRAAMSEVSAALFGFGDGTAPSTLDGRVPAAQFASAALEGGWPCHDGNGLGSDCTGF